MAVTGGHTYYFGYNLNSSLAWELQDATVYRGEIYGGKGKVATYKAGLTFFPTTDLVGTVRNNVTQDGAVSESCASLPYGDGQSCWGNGAGTPGPAFFTGEDRDAESNLDHFWFRGYSSNEGRWTTPDPAGLAAVDVTNPQSWNRYAYVGNNPLSRVDPLGLDDQDECDPNTGSGCGGTGGGDGSGGDGGSGGGSSGGGDPCGGGAATANFVGVHAFVRHSMFGSYGRRRAYAQRPVFGFPRHTRSSRKPHAHAFGSGPGSSCGSICTWLSNSSWWGGGYQNNFNNDQAIFNIAQNAIFSYSPSSSLNFDGFSQIYTLEQENLTIDAVALGNESLSPLDSLPGVDLLPPGIGDAEDAGLDYFETLRDQNNGQIDQILQRMAPSAPSTPTGGSCQ